MRLAKGGGGGGGFLCTTGSHPRSAIALPREFIFDYKLKATDTEPVLSYALCGVTVLL